MKYRFMQQKAKTFPVEKMALVLDVSKSGYYAYLSREASRRDQENEVLLAYIQDIHKQSRKTYGSPRIHAKLSQMKVGCSRKRVAKLMRMHGIQAKMRKKWKKTTKQGKGKPAKNLLQQNFYSPKPNHAWVGDITYVHTKEGWLYVSAVLDLFSRKIIGLSMGKYLDTKLVIRALDQAFYHRKPDKGLIHHSDKGCQYTSESFGKIAQDYGISLSMSGTGNCYDNAAMESFFHTLKTEHVHLQSFETREEAKRSIFEYIEVFYNRERIHSFLGYLSPEEFERNWSKKIA